VPDFTWVGFGVDACAKTLRLIVVKYLDCAVRRARPLAGLPLLSSRRI